MAYIKQECEEQIKLWKERLKEASNFIKGNWYSVKAKDNKKAYILCTVSSKNELIGKGLHWEKFWENRELLWCRKEEAKRITTEEAMKILITCAKENGHIKGAIIKIFNFTHTLSGDILLTTGTSFGKTYYYCEISNKLWVDEERDLIYSNNNYSGLNIDTT